MEAERGHWSRQVEFLLTLLGFAVGFGNIWRFPYMCLRNGGGAFLIPYLVALLLIATPLFYLEIYIGQFSGLSGAMAWSMVPLVKGIGWCMIIVSFIASLCYNQLMTYVLYYLGVSFSAELPWVSCNNSWNTENCFGGFRNASNITWDFSYNFTAENSTNATNVIIERKFVSPAEEFLQNNVLGLSDDIGNFGGLQYKLVLCHLSGWVVTSLCLFSGIKSVGKVVYVTATAPYVLLTILLIRGCLLPGSLQGILYYIRPEWSKLLDFKIWVEGTLQIFYSMGSFVGGNLALASYNKFHHNFQRDTVFVSVVNCLTSVYGGFAVFSVIGYMSHETGIPVDQVITSGPGLAFVVYPEALSKLPLPQLWSVLFFLMLTTVGIGTQIAHVQGVHAGLQDGFPKLLKGRRLVLVLGYCLVAGAIGLIFCTRAGMYWFQLLDWYGTVFAMILMAILGSLSIAWIYGLNRLFSDIRLMTGARPWFIVKILLGGVAPICLTICFVSSAAGFATPTYGTYEYPNWAIGIGWMIVTVGIVQLPVWMIIGMVKARGTVLQRLKTLCRPSDQWRPQRKDLRSAYRHEYELTKGRNGLSKDVEVSLREERNGLKMETGVPLKEECNGFITEVEMPLCAECNGLKKEVEVPL